MNTLNLIWAIVTFTTFTIAVRAHISTTRDRRNKFLNFYLQVFVIALLLFIIFGGILRSPTYLVFFFVSLGTAIPHILGRIFKFNQMKTKKMLLQLSQFSPIRLFWGILIFLLVMVVFIIWIQTGVISSKSFNDTNNFYNQLSATVLIGSYMIIYLMNLFQKAIFYEEGIFYYGFLWEWSDFQNFYWNKILRQNGDQELLLTAAQDTIFIKQIQLAFPAGTKEKVDLLLTQKIGKAGESS